MPKSGQQTDVAWQKGSPHVAILGPSWGQGNGTPRTRASERLDTVPVDLGRFPSGFRPGQVTAESAPPLPPPGPRGPIAGRDCVLWGEGGPLT